MTFQNTVSLKTGKHNSPSHFRPFCDLEMGHGYQKWYEQVKPTEVIMTQTWNVKLCPRKCQVWCSPEIHHLCPLNHTTVTETNTALNMHVICSA